MHIIGKSDIAEIAFWERVAEHKNSLPNVWGDDADDWNPERFLDPQRDFKEASCNIGIFSSS